MAKQSQYVKITIKKPRGGGRRKPVVVASRKGGRGARKAKS